MSFFGIPADTILWAIAGGVIPTLLWLWFWMRQDKTNPEPTGLLILTFAAGIISVFFVLPLQKYFAGLSLSVISEITALASVEEILKLAVVFAVALTSQFFDEPVDAVVYLVTGALGFAALENTLFLLNPLLENNISQALITGNLRFLGATVIHTISAAMIGVWLGLAFYRRLFTKVLHTIAGLILAIGLHTTFNFFIIQSSGGSMVTILATTWMVLVFLLLMVQRVRHLTPPPVATP